MCQCCFHLSSAGWLETPNPPPGCLVPPAHRPSARARSRIPAMPLPPDDGPAFSGRPSFSTVTSSAFGPVSDCDCRHVRPSSAAPRSSATPARCGPRRRRSPRAAHAAHPAPPSSPSAPSHGRAETRPSRSAMPGVGAVGRPARYAAPSTSECTSEIACRLASLIAASAGPARSGCVVEQLERHRGLHVDHRQAVCQHVMQFPGDGQPRLRGPPFLLEPAPRAPSRPCADAARRPPRAAAGVPSATATNTVSHAAMPVLTSAGGGSSPRTRGISHTTTHPAQHRQRVRSATASRRWPRVRNATINETKIGP